MSLGKLNFYELGKFPVMHENSTVRDCLVEMNAKNCGFCIITDSKNKMVGFFTDGDFRRVITNINVNFSALMVADIKSIMNFDFLFTKSGDFNEVEQIIEEKGINELPQLDAGNVVTGLFRVMRIRK